jgi:peptidoglycan/xylan/chitin deacetylase (PgdA/CDA1 family)
MSPGIPHYYSSLAAFQGLFAQGNPILTYHKLGPRPRRTRLKGLYVSARLFRRQLTELRAAGFSSGTLEACVGPSAERRMVVTFDDGYASTLEHGRESLAETSFRAIQFLVADLLGRTNEWDRSTGEVLEPLMDVAHVRDWLAAGHEIGSHTLSHPWLTRLPLPAAREEITGSKKALEDRFGRPVVHFCYPYGDWNDRVRELVIEAGYTTACTTEPGINTTATDPFALRRITARYRSRNWKNLWTALWRGWKTQ